MHTESRVGRFSDLRDDSTNRCMSINSNAPEEEEEAQFGMQFQSFSFVPVLSISNAGSGTIVLDRC